MKIFKPADTLILLGRHSRAGQPTLTITVGYACERDGSGLSEQNAWKWLVPQFPVEPFDTGFKREHGTFAVAGLACAPGNVPVAGLMVKASVGNVAKQVLVQGKRYWINGPTGCHASKPEPFITQDIGLAHAYGGKSWSYNPYGLGHIADTQSADGCALPNIEDPRAPILAPSDTPAVATLGPLPQGSPDQMRWLGALDQIWEKQRLPWLPDDTDPRWFDRVPQDQCSPVFWRGDEPWSVTNMHALYPEQSGQLPGLRPRLLVPSNDPAGCRELTMDLDTVWLFPTDTRVIVLYRAEFAVEQEDASDIHGFAVFTEKMNDPALPTAHYAELWRLAKAGPAIEAPEPPPTEQDAETLASHQASIAEKADAQRAQIGKAILTANQDALAEMQPYLPAKALKQAQDKIAALFVPVPAAQIAAPKALTAEAITAQVHAALAQGKAEASASLAEHGIDLDKVMASATKHPQPDIDTVDILDYMPISAEKKAAVQATMKEFQGKIDGVKAEAAKIEAQVTAMAAAAQEAKASRETAAQNPPDGALPTGPRQRLTRDELLARHKNGVSAAWTELEEEDLSDLDLTGIDMRGARLHACVLDRSILNRAKLNEAQLEKCQLNSTQLHDAQLERSQMTGCKMDRSEWCGANTVQARFTNCNFEHARLSNGLWRQSNAQDCCFDLADLSGIQATEAKFTACTLNGATAPDSVFDRASLTDCSLKAARFDHASLVRTTLTNCLCIAAQFIGARMPGLRTLAATSLQQACLDGADLTKASLQATSLKQASLREARLTDALIKECDLEATDGWHLIACRADFTGSRICNASWRGANLMQASFARTVLENVDWSGTNLHAAFTRTANARGIILDQALLTRCRLLEEHA